MILIVGSSHKNTAHYYKKINLEPSILITSDSMDYSVGHTSPQDTITYENLTRIASRADKVYFAYPDPNEFESINFYYEFINWVKDFNRDYKRIINFEPNFKLDPYNWNLKLPNLNKNDAVFIGCSFTQGVGIQKESDKYSSLVSKHFNLNCVNLGLGSTSNSYFFEIFSQLQFHSGQLVVIQLTVLERLRYCEEKGSLKNILLANPPYNSSLLDVYNNKFLFYETLTKIRMVAKIAQLQNLKLAIWMDNYKQECLGYTQEQQLYLYNIKSFVPASMMQNYCVDVGTDNCHPGILSNKNIADTLINFIEKVYK